MAMVERTPESRAARKQAEAVVDMALDVMLDVMLDSDNDIAWQGGSIIGALVDFKGEIPRSSGFSGFCKLAGKIDRFKRWSDMHLMACMVMRSLSDRQREAVAYDRFYRGRTKVAIDPFVPEKRVEIKWDDQHCASSLDCTVDAFRKRVYEGYRSIEAMMRQKVAA